MVRLYIEIAKLRENERLAREEITLEHLIAAAQRIIHPYQIEVKDTVWWSVYRLASVSVHHLMICQNTDHLMPFRVCLSQVMPVIRIARKQDRG